MSMILEEKKDLTNCNTFGVPAEARFYADLDRPEDLDAILSSVSPAAQNCLVLGGGSNILFVSSWEGLVLRPRFRDLVVLDQTSDHVVVTVGAGYNWDAFVRYTLAKKWYGVENLTLIPGTVGAAPIQNIGAYGVELADVFVSLDALDLRDGKRHNFSSEDCGFGYRTSRFKREPHYLITAITLRLSRHAEPQISYPSLHAALERHNLTKPGPEQVSALVREIRRSKLPDPKQWGNAGSFFRNPVVPKKIVDQLKADYPDLPAYPADENGVKIPAAWLVEACGWKGTRQKNCGVYDKHALILVNYGGATGAEIWSLAQDIQRSVLDRFGIELEPEPLIIRGKP